MYAGVPIIAPVCVSGESSSGSGLVLPVGLLLVVPAPSESLAASVSSSAWSGSLSSFTVDGSTTSAASAMPRASPKSVTITRPSSLRSTLCGLKSRCTSPAACAAASPRPAASTAAQTCAGGGLVASQVSRLPPSTSSIAM